MQAQTTCPNGESNLSSAVLGGLVDTVAGTTSNALKAAEGVSDDFTSLTRRMVVNTIRGLQDVAATVGQASLENARGGVQGMALLGDDLGAVAKAAALGLVAGTSEVGVQAGAAAKAAAIGLIHGSAEVAAEFGKVCKQNAIGAIQGTAEISSELGVLARQNSLGLIQGGTEAARIFLRGLAELKAEQAVEVAPSVPTADTSDQPMVDKPNKVKSK